MLRDEQLPLLLQSWVSFREDVHGLPPHRLQGIHSRGHQAFALRRRKRRGGREEGRGEGRKEREGRERREGGKREGGEGDSDGGMDGITRTLVSKDGFN